MVKTLLTLCKATCASGLFALPNYKQGEAALRPILHTLNLTRKLAAGIIYIENGSWS